MMGFIMSRESIFIRKCDEGVLQISQKFYHRASLKPYKSDHIAREVAWEMFARK